MFDHYHLANITRPPEHTTITEHRAPTDDSVRLLVEMERAAERKVIEAVRVTDTPVECVIHVREDFLNDRRTYVAVFKVGGSKMTATYDAQPDDDKDKVAIGIRDAWAFDVGYQWNSETSLTARTETRLEFRPKEDRLFGFGYRYRRDALEQGDVSLVWPVSQRWRIIGRYSYSFLDKERLEDFIGWEYEACCWRLRMVSRNYVSRRTGETDSSISLQLELKGLSQRVTAPDDLLDRGILGYRNIARAY